MLLDQQNLFSDAQAITGTAVSTNFINFGKRDTPPRSTTALKPDKGNAHIPLLVQVVEDFATLTSLAVIAEVSDTSDFASVKQVGSTGIIPVADLVAGAILPLDHIPLGTTARYMRLRYDVTGTNATAGKITAGVTAGIQTNG